MPPAKRERAENDFSGMTEEQIAAAKGEPAPAVAAASAPEVVAEAPAAPAESSETSG